MNRKTLKASELVALLKEAGYMNPKVDFSEPLFGPILKVDEDLRDARDWPLLWSVCKKAGVRYYCGGTFHLQVQVEPDLS